MSLEELMREVLTLCFLAFATLIPFLAPGSVRADEKSPPHSRKPSPVAGQPAKPAQTARGESGAYSVKGWVVLVHPERRSVVVKGASLEYEIFLTPETAVTRDGEKVGIGKIVARDRVDECHFNAKHICQKLTLTSGQKAGSAPLPSPK